MKISTSEYFIKEVYLSFRRNGWMALASVGTVMLSLFILGFFALVVLNLNKMADTLESQVQISVYLKADVEKGGTDAIEKELKQLNGVQSIKFIPKEQAIEKFREQLGDQQFLLDALDGTNPLPDSFALTASSPELVRDLARQAESIEGVESVSYSQDIVDHLFGLTHLIRLTGAAVIVLLFGAAIFIISNTIRLTVFARRKEIAIMKYVGATDWFIRWPFLLEGIVLGFAGGGIASLLLYAVYINITNEIYQVMAFFPLIPVHPSMDYAAAALTVCGMLIGAAGSALSLKRYLKV